VVSRPGFAVITVNYGSSGLLERNLAPLREVTGAIIVVVDNFSTTTERGAVEALAQREGWLLSTPVSNTGFGAGVNLGVEAAVAAGADCFVIINPDAIIGPADLGNLVTAARADRWLVVAPTILRPDGSVWSSGSDVYLTDGRIRSIRRRLPVPGSERFSWLSGACLALSRTAWDAIGGFDETYFLYWEDVDFSYRAVRAGLSLQTLADARVVHAEGGTQHTGLTKAGQGKSGVYYRYNIRNRLLFGARFLDARHWRTWLWHTPAVSFEILLQGGRRQFLHRPQVLLDGASGLVQGLAIAFRERRGRRAGT